MGRTGGINEPFCNIPGWLYPFHLAAEILLLDVSALVVFLLTAGQSYQKLRITVIRDIELDTYYRQTLLLHSPLELVQFLAAEQKLAVTARIVLSPTSPPVLRNVHVLDIQLVVAEITEGIHQRSLAGPDGLDLRACKH